ncbi:MAG: hypothetical protein GF313_03855 [Caldithrix sp.]|nr:hypothetical protein [Caldithrix sp.]
MMKFLITENTYLPTLGGLFMCVFMLGHLPQAAHGQTYPGGILEEIPQGANRIILIQEGVPPADIYVDTYNLLRNMDFQITASEETLVIRDLRDILENDPLVFAAKKQINQDLAIWMVFNCNVAPGGGKLIASARYAENVDSPVAQWQPAKWSSGKAQQAFIEALDIIRHGRYDAVNFEIGVAVSEK